MKLQKSKWFFLMWQMYRKLRNFYRLCFRVKKIFFRLGKKNANVNPPHAYNSSFAYFFTRFITFLFRLLMMLKNYKNNNFEYF